MPSLVVADISSHLNTFTQPEADAFVFTSPHGMLLRHASFRRRVWLPARAATGLGIHLHDQRHTGNQLAAQAGASPRELMERRDSLRTSAGSDLGNEQAILAMQVAPDVISPSLPVVFPDFRPERASPQGYQELNSGWSRRLAAMS